MTLQAVRVGSSVKTNYKVRLDTGAKLGWHRFGKVTEIVVGNRDDLPKLGVMFDGRKQVAYLSSDQFPNLDLVRF